MIKVFFELGQFTQARGQGLPLPEPNKFILPVTGNMPFLMFCFKLHA